MSIAVIIPVYNGEKFIAAAIDSVLAQTIAVNEIIVIDDGSSDNSAVIVKSYSQVQYLYQKNSGVSAARNHGIKVANSKFIAFLDQDDLFLPQKMAVSLQQFKLDPQLQVVRGGYQNIFAATLFQQEQARFKTLSVSSNFLLGSALFKRNLLIKVGGFDQTLAAAEDIDLWLRLETMGARIKNIDEILLYYRQHEHNTTRSAGFVSLNTKSTLRVLHKNFLLRRAQAMRS
jgi:glycosyltransferase involved in cell wall biosynthesis